MSRLADQPLTILRESFEFEFGGSRAPTEVIAGAPKLGHLQSQGLQLSFLCGVPDNRSSRLALHTYATVLQTLLQSGEYLATEPVALDDHHLFIERNVREDQVGELGAQSSTLDVQHDLAIGL